MEIGGCDINIRQRLPEESKREEEGHFTLLVNKHGGTFNLSNYGILKIPSGALKRQTKLTIRPVSKDVPSPAGELDAVVSSMIQFEPSNLVFKKPIDVTLVHNGPLHTAHYENVAMGYNDVTNTWERIQETKHDSPPCSSIKTAPLNSLQIQLTKLTVVTVVTRLITNLFVVPRFGCKVKSSACPEVTLEFPPGAVCKPTKGFFKVLPMPEVLPLDIPQELHFCPIVVVGGFEDAVFSEDVTLTVPYPATWRPAGHERDVGQIHVMRCEGREWKDVTDVVHCSKSESTIEIRVKHFSKILVCVTMCTTVSTLLFSANQLYVWLKATPAPPHFFAYKFKYLDATEILKILLVVGSNAEQILQDFKESSGYQELTRITGQVDMYPNTKVKPRVEGGFTIYDSMDIQLRFKKDMPCHTELKLQERRDCYENNLIVKFCSTQNEREQVVGEFTVSRGELGLPTRIPPTDPGKMALCCDPGPNEDAFYINNGMLIIIEVDTLLSSVKFKGRTLNEIKKREGSSKDFDTLTNTFVKHFGFQCKNIRNEREFVILAELEKTVRENNHHDCCMVCVMSHGELGVFFDIDSNKIGENSITNTLKKYFYGKPKILLLQTCRTPPDPTTESESTRDDQAPNSELPSGSDVVLRDGELPIGYPCATRSTRDDQAPNSGLPSESDAVLRDSELLIGYACCEGKKAYRGEVSNSFYLQTLCTVFKEKYSDTPVQNMLTEVNRRVQEQMIERSEKRVVCEFKSTLSKDLYLTSLVNQFRHLTL